MISPLGSNAFLRRCQLPPASQARGCPFANPPGPLPSTRAGFGPTMSKRQTSEEPRQQESHPTPAQLHQCNSIIPQPPATGATDQACPRLDPAAPLPKVGNFALKTKPLAPCTVIFPWESRLPSLSRCFKHQLSCKRSSSPPSVPTLQARVARAASPHPCPQPQVAFPMEGCTGPQWVF